MAFECSVVWLLALAVLGLAGLCTIFLLVMSHRGDPLGRGYDQQAPDITNIVRGTAGQGPHGSVPHNETMPECGGSLGGLVAPGA